MRWWPRRKVYLDNLPKTHDFRFLLVFAIALTLVFGALYGVGYAVAGNKLPSGTTVAEVDVGGMTPDQARTVLQDKLAPRLQRPIKASVAGKTYTLDPQLTGLTFDIDATLAEATGGSPWDPRHMLHVLMGGDQLDPVVAVDDTELTSRLKRIAGHVERKPVDSRVSFRHARVKVVYGHAGRRLDYQRSGDRLIAALIAGDRSVDFAAEAVQPHVTAITATRFADSVAKRALNGPVKVKVADAAMTLQPGRFGPALRALPSKRGLRLDVDQAVLMKRSRAALRGLPHHPVDARIRFDGARPRVVPGTSGVTVAPADLAKALLKAVARSGKRRVARAAPTPDNPNVTTEDVRMMRIRDRVSSTSARFRIGNDQLDPVAQLAHLDGALIKPGQTFSLLSRLPDSSSPAASFVASLTYGAAFFAGLAIPEHSPARLYTGAFGPGRDARIEPPDTDLILKNTSPFGLYIRAYVANPGGAGSRARVGHVEMWSTTYWHVRVRASQRYNVIQPDVVKNPAKSCIPRAGRPGFDIDVTRVLTRAGHKRVETSHASYAVLDEVRCTGGKRSGGRR